MQFFQECKLLTLLGMTNNKSVVFIVYIPANCFFVKKSAHLHEARNLLEYSKFRVVQMVFRGVQIFCFYTLIICFC